MDETNTKITLRKLEVGRRQLRAAIRMWFTGDDEVATFALAYAAHEVFHTLYKQTGGKHGYERIRTEYPDNAQFWAFMKEGWGAPVRWEDGFRCKSCSMRGTADDELVLYSFSDPHGITDFLAGEESREPLEALNGAKASQRLSM